ncbi:uncharacterized protein [Macrobrachium rosenbergii]|uniref:uncharacterized protein n=1 Tax=Macrobrachium rosenbergii TaxID=79674 RepID=UPI0034D3C269
MKETRALTTDDSTMGKINLLVFLAECKHKLKQHSSSVLKLKEKLRALQNWNKRMENLDNPRKIDLLHDTLRCKDEMIQKLLTEIKTLKHGAKSNTAGTQTSLEQKKGELLSLFESWSNKTRHGSKDMFDFVMENHEMGARCDQRPGQVSSRQQKKKRPVKKCVGLKDCLEKNCELEKSICKLKEENKRLKEELCKRKSRATGGLRSERPPFEELEKENRKLKQDLSQQKVALESKEDRIRKLESRCRVLESQVRPSYGKWEKELQHEVWGKKEQIEELQKKLKERESNINRLEDLLKIAATARNKMEASMAETECRKDKEIDKLKRRIEEFENAPKPHKSLQTLLMNFVKISEAKSATQG